MRKWRTWWIKNEAAFPSSYTKPTYAAKAIEFAAYEELMLEAQRIAKRLAELGGERATETLIQWQTYLKQETFKSGLTDAKH